MTQSIVPTRVDRQAQAFADLALRLHDSPTSTETADAVVRYAIPAIACSHAGIALQDACGNITIGTVSSDVSCVLYTLQIQHGDGPMIAAIQQGVVLHIPNAADETRWPAWRRRAVALGVGSVAHLPLTAGSTTLGGLSLYKEAAYGFSVDDLAVAHVLARHAAVAVAAAQRRENMSSKVDARKLVGQAMGILMERHDLDADQAFAVLRRYAEDNNLKLQAAAEHLIATRHLTSPQPAAIAHRATAGSRPRPPLSASTPPPG